MRVLVMAVAAAWACGPGNNTVCGPGSASPTGLVASGSGLQFTYMGMMEGANNDCTPTGSNVISVTIELIQVDGTGFVAFCIPRPQDLDTDLTVGSNVQGNQPPAALESFEGTTSDGCVYAYDATQPTTGSLHATGVCNNGAGSAGFALTVDATATLVPQPAGSGSSTCLPSATMQLAGTVAIP